MNGFFLKNWHLEPLGAIVFLDILNEYKLSIYFKIIIEFLLFLLFYLKNFCSQLKLINYLIA